MAQVAAILRAVGKANWREIRTFQSIAGQNFFLLVALIAMQPEAAGFLALLLGILMLFPLSSDPLEKVPEVRRQLWPVSRGAWASIRLATVFLSPVIWIAAYVLRKMGWQSGLEIAGLGLAAHLVKRLAGRWDPGTRFLHSIPAPPGVVGRIVQLHLREMLTTLDPYVAAGLTLTATMYRLSGHRLDPASVPILAMMVVLALSTSAQVMIALDGSGAQRYRLMPIHGWQVLLGKDIAFLALALLLVAPLEIPAALSSALAALTVGHFSIGAPAAAQVRWRFTSGVMFPNGAMQVFAIFAVGNSYLRFGPVVLAATLFVWIASVFWFGPKVTGT